MKILFFSSKLYDKESFERSNQNDNFRIEYTSSQLNEQSVSLATGYEAICTFVNDHLDETILKKLYTQGVKIILLRCAGFNNIDLEATKKLGIQVARVPAYSPYAVAEHAVALLLCLNRKIHKAYNRVREGNFELKGLEGFDLHGKTVGLIGAGKIGECFAKIMVGFGCKVKVYDPSPNPSLLSLPVELVEYDAILNDSDIISLHCPLNSSTHHLISKKSISVMKNGVIVLNTSRGAIINTKDVINALKTRQIGALGIDVYEEEEHIFFKDHLDEIIQDDTFERLLTFPNVLITGHQGFLTYEALTNIAETTLKNAEQLKRGQHCLNLLLASPLNSS